MEAKNKSFQSKIGQYLKFLIYKSYIPQKKAKNMYNTDSKRKSIIFCKKIIIFEISDFFFQRRDPMMSKLLKKCFQFFKNFKIRIPEMTFMGPFKHKKEQSQEFWVA